MLVYKKTVTYLHRESSLIEKKPPVYVHALVSSVKICTVRMPNAKLRNHITALFRNTRTLLKSAVTAKFVFRCRQSSKRTSQKTAIHFNRIKGSRLSVVIGRFRSILFVSVFQGSLAVAIIMIDGSKNVLRSNRCLEQSSRVSKKGNERACSW